MPEVVLIRPGFTDFDEQKRIQGTLDLPLNTHGQEQLNEIIAQLKDIDLDVIITAPSEPSRSTAEAIAESLDIPLKESKDLRNLNQGLWQGLQVEDVRRKYPKVYRQWQESPETICPPDGETVQEAVSRIRKALLKPLKKKTSFAIVSSEPLATLIGCVIRGGKPELPDSSCACGRAERIEFVQSGRPTNGQAVPAPTKGARPTVSANGERSQ